MVTRRAVVQALAACATARAAARGRGHAACSPPPTCTPGTIRPSPLCAGSTSSCGASSAAARAARVSLGPARQREGHARPRALRRARHHARPQLRAQQCVPATRILSLPYVFDSTEHMRRAFDGALGAEILAACERRELVGLAIYDSGSRNFYNARRPSRRRATCTGSSSACRRRTSSSRASPRSARTRRRCRTARCSRRCRRT